MSQHTTHLEEEALTFEWRVRGGGQAAEQTTHLEEAVLGGVPFASWSVETAKRSSILNT